MNHLYRNKVFLFVFELPKKDWLLLESLKFW
jgi:hypothetical protein